MATQASNDVVFSPAQLPVNVTGMQSMANKVWLPMLAMGLMVVVGAFIFGIINSSIAADYFANSKEVREAAATGSDIATDKALSNLPRYGCRRSSSLALA